MSESVVRVGMGQMLVEGGRPDENLGRAVNMVLKAAEDRCAVLVLPECLDVGWTHPAARRLAQPIPGHSSDWLCRVAAESGIYVVAGLTEREGATLFNTAILIGPDGRIRLKHRKINILDIAQDLYATGNRLGVAETSFGPVGIDICADNFPDSLFRFRWATPWRGWVRRFYCRRVPGPCRRISTTKRPPTARIFGSRHTGRSPGSTKCRWSV